MQPNKQLHSADPFHHFTASCTGDKLTINKEFSEFSEWLLHHFELDAVPE